MRPPTATRKLHLATAALIALALAIPAALATHETTGITEEGCAITKGGWSSEPRGHNPGALLEERFDEVFPAGLLVGDLFFASAEEVRDFLDENNFQLEEQAVALAINIGFGDAGLLDGTVGPVVVESDDENLDGRNAYQLLEMAEDVLLADDTPTNPEYSSLIDAITGLNEESFGCAEVCPDMELTALAQADGSIDLSWTDVGADSYNLYRSADGGDFVLLASTSETEHTDESTATGVTYSYALTIVVDGRESGICARAEATAIPFFTAPILGAVALLGSVGAYRVLRRART